VDECDDGDLAARIAAAGTARQCVDEERELCLRLSRRVRLYARHHLRDDDAAGDLAQTAMVLMLQKLRGGEVREPRRIGSFVLGVARMLVHDRRRGARRERAWDGEDVPVSAADPDPLAREALARCLEALGQRERSVLVMTYYGEQTAAQIATAVGVSEGNVRVLRHRSLAKLRECMGLESAQGAPR
jgi:RNA polymerase sigma-70 factor (ECF subfamily)